MSSCDNCPFRAASGGKHFVVSAWTATTSAKTRGKVGERRISLHLLHLSRKLCEDVKHSCAFFKKHNRWFMRKYRTQQDSDSGRQSFTKNNAYSGKVRS